MSVAGFFFVSRYTVFKIYLIHLLRVREILISRVDMTSEARVYYIKLLI